MVKRLKLKPLKNKQKIFVTRKINLKEIKIIKNFILIVNKVCFLTLDFLINTIVVITNYKFVIKNFLVLFLENLKCLKKNLLIILKNIFLTIYYITKKDAPVTGKLISKYIILFLYLNKFYFKRIDILCKTVTSIEFIFVLRDLLIIIDLNVSRLKKNLLIILKNIFLTIYYITKKDAPVTEKLISKYIILFLYLNKFYFKKLDILCKTVTSIEFIFVLRDLLIIIDLNVSRLKKKLPTIKLINDEEPWWVFEIKKIIFLYFLQWVGYQLNWFDYLASIIV